LFAFVINVIFLKKRICDQDGRIINIAKVARYIEKVIFARVDNISRRQHFAWRYLNMYLSRRRYRKEKEIINFNFANQCPRFSDLVELVITLSRPIDQIRIWGS